MKKKNYFLPILAAGLLSINSYGQINFPQGRIAMSFDGNIHDDDDIVALPVSLGIVNAAGLKSKLVHVEFSNNKCGTATTVQEDTDDTPAFSGNDAQHMIASANGMVTRFGFSSSIMYDHTVNASAAQSHLAAEINSSTATNPLFIIAAGPMETIWRALNGSNSAAHSNVYIISHGKWNEDYYRADCSPHTWNSMKTNFNKVHYVGSQGNGGIIPDQNGRLNTPISNWDWMKNASDVNLQWMFSRNPFMNKFDPSDAGMVYYLVTGGPLNNGNKAPTVTDIKNLLTSTVTSGNLAPTVSFTAPVNNSNFIAPLKLMPLVDAKDQDGSIVSVDLYINNIFVRAEKVVPYEWNKSVNDAALTNLTNGTYVLKAIATDNKGLSSASEITITVGPVVVSGNPLVSFVQPLNGSSTGKNIVVIVNASDNDGTISNVKLFLDGSTTPIRQENTSPYVWNSTNGGSLDPLLTNLSAGAHTLKAVATDNVGKISEATISIMVSSTARIGSLESDAAMDLVSYPNPFKDRLLVEAGKENDIYSANLLSLEGSSIDIPVTINGSKAEFLTEGLRTGFYIVELETYNGKIIQKVLKQ